MVLWVLFRVPTTTHFNKMCCCMVLFRVPTTTHFNKMCCCMVLWVLFRVPTTLLKLCTHNTIQQHILLKCGVVGTRNNTHITIHQHTLLKCVVVCHLWTIVHFHQPTLHTIIPASQRLLAGETSKGILWRGRLLPFAVLRQLTLYHTMFSFTHDDAWLIDYKYSVWDQHLWCSNMKYGVYCSRYV